jgi:MFS transporter, FHS family, glucose/mannose:H+ symporter
MPESASPLQHHEPAPALPLMHAAFILAGFGTMLLGPILPLLSQRWHLTDSQAGLMVLAQFCGATVGGSTVSSKLQRDMLLGLAAAAVGFLLFAFAPGINLACAALLVGGFGVGRVIATVNIIAGARYTQNRGSALSRLNFTWSFGALLSPLLAAWLIRLSLQTRLTAFAALFLACTIALAMQIRRAPITTAANAAAAESTHPLPLRIFLYFAALLFIYGGLETCLSAWLTTYALRYGTTSLVLSEYTMVLLLCGLTAGRALAAWLLLTMRDVTLQRMALILAAGLAAALALAHQAAAIATLAVFLGVCLAPIFPATFALLMARRPSASQAGIVLAASGLGAAALPALMGVVSTHAGSLQVALALPVAAAILMFLMSLFPPTNAPERT